MNNGADRWRKPSATKTSQGDTSLRHLDPARPRQHFRRAFPVVGAAALTGAALFAWPGQAHAVAPATVSVSPGTGLVSGNNVTVTVTTPNDTPSNVFIAVTQCGNATSSGAPLASLATDGSDCIGATGFGSTLQVIGAGGAAAPTGPVTAGTYHATLKLQETNIGTANTKCIAVPPATIPCTVVAATATTAGAYTDTGAFQGQATIAYANNTTTTSTTTATTSTTRPNATSTTTHSGSTGTGATTTLATQSGSGASTAAAGSSVAASGTGLASTGPSGLTWPLAFTGLLLLDLGYLAVSATRKARRRRLRVDR